MLDYAYIYYSQDGRGKSITFYNGKTERKFAYSDRLIKTIPVGWIFKPDYRANLHLMINPNSPLARLFGGFVVTCGYVGGYRVDVATLQSKHRAKFRVYSCTQDCAVTTEYTYATMHKFTEEWTQHTSVVLAMLDACKYIVKNLYPDQWI